jgi:hypothetical protein
LNFFINQHLSSKIFLLTKNLKTWQTNQEARKIVAKIRIQETRDPTLEILSVVVKTRELATGLNHIRKVSQARAVRVIPETVVTVVIVETLVTAVATVNQTEFVLMKIPYLK